MRSLQTELSYKFGSRIEDVEERLNDFLARRCDEAHGTVPVLDQVQKSLHRFEHARAIEDTSSVEHWKDGKLRWSGRGDRRLLEEQTHLQDDIKREHTR